MKLNPLTLPPFWMVIGVIAIWGSGRIFPQDAPGMLRVLAVVLFAGATLLTAWSFRVFQTHKTPILPDQTPNSLISSGPFAWTRNPIYLSMVLVLLSAGAWTGSLISLPIAAVFAVWVHKTHILHEEAALKSSFPDEAQTYLDKTPRWFGPF